jgi:hypothetical protein
MNKVVIKMKRYLIYTSQRLHILAIKGLSNGKGFVFSWLASNLP